MYLERSCSKGPCTSPLDMEGRLEVTGIKNLGQGKRGGEEETQEGVRTGLEAGWD